MNDILRGFREAIGMSVCLITRSHRWGKAKSQNAVSPDKLKECRRCGKFQTVKTRAPKVPA